MNPRGRRGWTDYADLLQQVMATPGTTAEVAARYGMAIRSVRGALYAMRDAGLIFENSWRRCTTGECLQAVWSTQGPPAPRPSALRPPGAPAPAPQLRRFCHVVSALMCEAFCTADLADITGATVNRLRPLLRHLHNLGLIYIARWRPTAGSWPVPIYRWGGGRKDALRPKAQPEREAWRKQHQIRRQRLFWVRMIFLTAGAKPA